MKRISKDYTDRIDHCMKMVEHGFIPVWIDPEEIYQLSIDTNVKLHKNGVDRFIYEAIKSQRISQMIIELFYNKLIAKKYGEKS